MLQELENGDYLIEFYSNNSLRKIWKGEWASHVSSPCSIFLRKNREIDPKDMSRDYTLIYHHSFHTYEDYPSLNPRGSKEVLESTKNTAKFQLLNLHGIGKVSYWFPLTLLREIIEDVGFDSIHYIWIKKDRAKEAVEIKEIESPEVENIKTGNFRWLLLRSDE